MSLTRKIQYKQSVRARKITEKNRLKKKIRDCLRKAERYKTSFNRYGKLQKRCKQMKGGYLSKKQSISGKRTRSKSKSINGKQP